MDFVFERCIHSKRVEAKVEFTRGRGDAELGFKFLFRSWRSPKSKGVTIGCLDFVFERRIHSKRVETKLEFACGGSDAEFGLELLFWSGRASRSNGYEQALV